MIGYDSKANIFCIYVLFAAELPNPKGRREEQPHTYREK